MNEPRLDPELESLAAKLAAQSPRLPAAESQALLYQCAFSAGQSAASRNLRRWQGLAAALAVLLAGACLPLAALRLPMAFHRPAASDGEPSPRALADAQADPAEIDVDAWQQPSDSSRFLEQGLTRFGQVDPALRSLAAANLSRRVLDQQ